jgi:hypothetical protein
MGIRILRFLQPILLLLLLAPASASAIDCNQYFANLTYKAQSVVASEEVKAARMSMQWVLKGQGIPAFLKKTASGEVPVALVNKASVEKLLPYLDNSLGTQTYMQPQYNNDHGGIRVLRQLIDVDTPGARHFGEIHRTGIAWKPLESYVKRGGGTPIIEVSYLLKPEEKLVADFYHRVRRAALYRVPFTFGAGVPDRNLPNMLSAGEHCFIYCKGSAVARHLSEIDEKLKAAGPKDLNEFYAKPEVVEFLQKARQAVMNADPAAGNSLSPTMLMENAAIKELAMKMAPAEVAANPVALQNFANLVVGRSVTNDYKNLLNALNVSGATSFNDMNNPRVTAVLIYDSGAAENSFREAGYETQGKFGNWSKDQQVVMQPEGEIPFTPNAPKPGLGDLVRGLFK